MLCVFFFLLYCNWNIHTSCSNTDSPTSYIVSLIHFGGSTFAFSICNTISGMLLILNKYDLLIETIQSNSSFFRGKTSIWQLLSLPSIEGTVFFKISECEHWQFEQNDICIANESGLEQVFCVICHCANQMWHRNGKTLNPTVLNPIAVHYYAIHKNSDVMVKRCYVRNAKKRGTTWNRMLNEIGHCSQSDKCQFARFNRRSRWRWQSLELRI